MIYFLLALRLFCFCSNFNNRHSKLTIECSMNGCKNINLPYINQISITAYQSYSSSARISFFVISLKIILGVKLAFKKR